jgi:paraquat-inducible protein B
VSQIETPQIEPQRHYALWTSIWLVPLIALLISGWLIYHHYSQIGPEIRIAFAGSDGLVAGESVVKFRDLVVGKVTRIELQPDGDGVVVVARMSKEIETYLNTDTRFWIAKPQVDYKGVSGLDTLVNGTYITMHARKGIGGVYEFRGLSKPYRSKDEGVYYHLRTHRLNNIYVGAPVHYHNLQAGVVEEVRLSENRNDIDLKIFIRHAFVDLINISTRFWYQDLVALKFEDGDVKVEVAPLLSVFTGSISFDTKLDKDYPPVEENHIFRLHNKQSDFLKHKIGGEVETPETFRMSFAGEINGLHEGAPVRYEGFKVGEIDQAHIFYNSKTHLMEADIRVTIDTSFFDDTEHNGTVNLMHAVANGLRAELKNSNPLMRSLYIDLTYPSRPDTHQQLVRQDGVWIFPTKKLIENKVLSQLEHLLTTISQMVDENRETLRESMRHLNTTLANIEALTGRESFRTLSDDLNRTLERFNALAGDEAIGKMPDEINKALTELNTMLRTTKKVLNGYGSGSLFGKKLESMLREIGRTSAETKRLIRKLNQKPNSLIFGD